MRRSTPEKRHALNKRVRREKARLRRRTHKVKPKRWVYMTLTDMELETINNLRAYAKAHHCSVHQVIRKVLRNYMENHNGIQTEL